MKTFKSDGIWQNSGQNTSRLLNRSIDIEIDPYLFVPEEDHFENSIH